MKITSNDIITFSECISFVENKSAIFNVDIYLKDTKKTTTEKIGRANIMLSLSNGNMSTDYEIFSNKYEYDSNEIATFIAKECFKRCKALS